MIKIVAIGLWVCLVALGSLMLGFKMNTAPSEAAIPAETVANIPFGHTEPFNVPIMIDGVVQGYILSQLAFILEPDVKDQIKVPIGVFINDAIFSTYFTSYTDRRDFEKVNFADVKKKIIDDVNKKFPIPVLKDLLVEQFNYISEKEVRDINSVE